MFTGIIEELGKIQGMKLTKDGMRLTIQAKKVLDGLKIGDSMACDGVCLTVTACGKEYFDADVMDETLSCTTLVELKAGKSVNLERAMEAGGRFGGHMVSGHVDGMGKVMTIKKDGFASIVEIHCSPKLLAGMVEKGSIAINGVSLTISGILSNGFLISMIPHTKAVTKELKKGDAVNLEQDLIGKYVHSFLEKKTKKEDKKDPITKEFLIENGF